MVPAGTRSPLFFRALRMDWMLAPPAAMAPGPGRISDVLGWRRRSLRRRGRRRASAAAGRVSRCRSAFSSLSGLSEETARKTIGKSLMLPAMACGWTSVGQRPLGVGDGPVDLVPGAVQVGAVGERPG